MNVIISFFVLQFVIVLVSIEDVSDLYSLDILINGINDTIFSLINTETFKSLIVEILEFLAILRLQCPTQ